MTPRRIPQGMSRALAVSALLLVAAAPSAQAGPLTDLLCDPAEICTIQAPPCDTAVDVLCDSGEPFRFCFVYARAIVVTFCL